MHIHIISASRISLMVVVEGFLFHGLAGKV